jgi:exonuclease VII small subunit
MAKPWLKQALEELEQVIQQLEHIEENLERFSDYGMDGYDALKGTWLQARLSAIQDLADALAEDLKEAEDGGAADSIPPSGTKRN